MFDSISLFFYNIFNTLIEASSNMNPKPLLFTFKESQ